VSAVRSSRVGGALARAPRGARLARPHPALVLLFALVAPFVLSLAVVAPGDPGALLDPAAWHWSMGGRLLGAPPAQPPAVLGILTRASSTRITGVLPASPAALAGLRRGDVLCGLDEHEITDPTQIRQLLSSRQPGDDVFVDVERDGARLRVRVVLAAPPTGP
jgi:membrane-associated protease RseP (regulator of RpoE activity)